MLVSKIFIGLDLSRLLTSLLYSLDYIVPFVSAVDTSAAVDSAAVRDGPGSLTVSFAVTVPPDADEDKTDLL